MVAIVRGCAGDVVISGHRQQVVDESHVVEMLDSLALDIDEEHSSVDSDSDTSVDIPADDRPLPTYHSNTPLLLSAASDSAQKCEKPLIQEVSFSDSRPSSKAVKWSGADRFRRGLFKNCVIDVSSTVQSAEAVGPELPSGSGGNSVETVRHTCNSHNLSKKVTEEQTALERVKTCMYEWKTTELFAFLCASPTKPIDTGVIEHENTNHNVSNVDEVSRDSTEHSADGREETVKQYERKVGEFYAAKPRVRFADSCKQVVKFFNCTSLFV